MSLQLFNQQQTTNHEEHQDHKDHKEKQKKVKATTNNNGE